MDIRSQITPGTERPLRRPCLRRHPEDFGRLAFAVALCVLVINPPAHASSAQEGQEIAQRLCATCHAIGRAERSPIPVAPAFRRMEPRVDLDQLVERLQYGVIVGHPEMPAFKLKEDEARALVAYMRLLRD